MRTCRPQARKCWFCKGRFPVEALIAGYDTFDEQRLACLACNERMSGNWRPAKVQAFQDAYDLGCAWAEAEAALPEGWYALDLRRNPPETEAQYRYVASTYNSVVDPEYGGSGPTPAAALRALADVLSQKGCNLR